MNDTIAKALPIGGCDLATTTASALANGVALLQVAEIRDCGVRVVSSADGQNEEREVGGHHLHRCDNSIL